MGYLGDLVEQEIQRQEEASRADILNRLIEAVEALPVEEWVEQDHNDEPVLIGYVMQARSEWDRVKEIIAEARAVDAQ